MKPPPFCRDWQSLPPLTPASKHANRGLPLLAVNGGLLGMIVTTEIPAREIVPVLPRGVRLPASVTPDDPYPVSIAFGYQHDVHMARFAWLPGSSYLEFAVGVADLELEEPANGFTGPCGILGRLDLNSLLPIVLGRLLGLQKVLRLARTDENAFGLRTFWGGTTVAFGSMNRFDHPMRASECAGLAPLMRTFAQPLASRSILGTLAFTSFVWHWDQGLAQPVSCDVTIARGLGIGQYTSAGVAGSIRCTGAWQVRVPWTMEAFRHPGGPRSVPRRDASRPRE